MVLERRGERRIRIGEWVGRRSAHLRDVHGRVVMGTPWDLMCLQGPMISCRFQTVLAHEQ
jgi:hypothetical protein